MDWNLAIEDNRRMLKRIVALLFALAGLAERLAGLPRPVRACCDVDTASRRGCCARFRP